MIRLQNERFWTRMFNVNRLVFLSEWWTEANAQKTQINMMKYVCFLFLIDWLIYLFIYLFRILDIIGKQIIGILNHSFVVIKVGLDYHFINSNKLFKVHENEIWTSFDFFLLFISWIFSSIHIYHHHWRLIIDSNIYHWFQFSWWWWWWSIILV